MGSPVVPVRVRRHVVNIKGGDAVDEPVVDIATKQKEECRAVRPYLPLKI